MTFSSHARVYDLPGWPTPPRVRDIANHAGSWGRVLVSNIGLGAVCQDEFGRLWVDGSATPRFQWLDAENVNPGAYVYWTERGIGLYVDPKSYQYLDNVSGLDMEPDQWVPVAIVAQELPGFAK